MKSLVRISLLLLAVVAITSTARAQSKPIQISLVTPVQIFPDNQSIAGIRWNLIYGRNVSVTGLDFGLVNHTTAGLSQGVQFGLVGLADADFTGFQNNVINVTMGRAEGFQWGVFNHAGHASGFQLGLVNYAQSMRGLQIGLVNIIGQGGAFPVFPIVNWSF